jgi:hypothetical protein
VGIDRQLEYVGSDEIYGLRRAALVVTLCPDPRLHLHLYVAEVVLFRAVLCDCEFYDEARVQARGGHVVQTMDDAHRPFRKRALLDFAREGSRRPFLR